MSWLLRETIEFYDWLKNIRLNANNLEEYFKSLKYSFPLEKGIIEAILATAPDEINEESRRKMMLQSLKDSLTRDFTKTMEAKYDFHSFLVRPLLRESIEQYGVKEICFWKTTPLPIGLMRIVEAYQERVKKEGYSLKFGTVFHEEGQMNEEFFIRIEDPTVEYGAVDFDKMSRVVMYASNQAMNIDVRILLPEKTASLGITDVIAEKFKQIPKSTQ